MEKNLTSGSVLKNIVYFSLPYLLSYFLQTLYGMADLFIIGQFEGVASTTAVSIGSQVMHMITVMIVGLAMGSTVTIAQAIGARDKKSASRTIGNTVTLFMAVAVGLMVILLLLVHPIVSVMSTPSEAVAGTVAYLTVCFIGIPCITAYNIISSIFRGLGDSKSPMYFIAIACVVNIGLDYLFMGYFRLGPVGAALGTTLSQLVSVIIALIVIMKKETGISLSRKDFRPDHRFMKKILNIGIPVALQDGFIQVAFIVITVIANRRGLDTAAAVGIVAVVIQFVAGSVVSLFTSDATVVVLGSQYIRGYIFDCIFAGVHFCFSGYFCAYGRSGFSFLHNIISILLVRIPGVYLTSLWFPDNLFPMGIATACGSLLSVIICFILFRWMLAHPARS